MAKSRSEKDKRYEERHKEERKAKNVIWGTSIPRAFAEEIDAFLKKHRYTKVKLIEEGYKALLEQADEIDTDLAKIMDGYDDFFESELKQFEEEKKKIRRRNRASRITEGYRRATFPLCENLKGGFCGKWREYIVSTGKEHIVSAQ